MFDKELAFFIDHQAELVSKFGGRVLLLKDAAVVGDFASPLEAYLAGQKKYAPGTFMVQPCEPGPAAYTVTLSSSHEVVG
jgi:hypothetical protein